MNLILEGRWHSQRLPSLREVFDAIGGPNLNSVFAGSIDDAAARLSQVLTGQRREGFIAYLP